MATSTKPQARFTRILTNMNRQVILTETEIFWLLEIEGYCSLSDAEPVNLPEINNQHKAAVDVRSKATQVLNKPTITQNQQTIPYNSTDAGTQVNGWDLYDCYNDTQPVEDGLSPLISLERSLCSSQVAPGWSELLGVPWPKDPLKSQSETTQTPLKFVWLLQCEETNKMRVTSIDCNPGDQMLIAASYTKPTPSCSSDGFILVWNVQNVTQPEIKIQTFTSPLVVKFCPSHPNLLASGNENGMIYFFDISVRPVLRSEDHFNSVRHKGSVMDLVWMRDSVLSCGYDGRVLLWATPTSSTSQNQVLLQLQSSRRPLEFPRPIDEKETNYATIPAAHSIELDSKSGAADENVNSFYVGSGDGSLHLYSTLQSHVPLETHRRHLGPVKRTRLVISSRLLISLGEEGRVVTQTLPGSETLEINGGSSSDTAVDFACSSTTAVVIAVLRRSRLEIWKILPAPRLLADCELQNLLEPTCVVFVPNSNGIIVGDSSGRLQIILWREIQNRL